jgi:hypothetical protein
MKNKNHIIEAIAICIVLSCVVIIYVNKVFKQKDKPNVSLSKDRFGIVTSEDIYIDNMEKNAKYTSHGRLITNK